MYFNARDLARKIGSIAHMVSPLPDSENDGGENGFVTNCSSWYLRIRSIGDEYSLESGHCLVSSDDSSPGIISKCLTISMSYDIYEFDSREISMVWDLPKSIALKAYSTPSAAQSGN